MGRDNTTARKKLAKEIRADKVDRLKEVRRMVQFFEKRDLSDVELIDEILEEGLSRREKKFGKAESKLYETGQVPVV